MKLASVYFDDTVCIPGGKDVGGGTPRQDLRDSCFHASDGWRIAMTISNGGRLFALWREGMERPAYVGGYGFTFACDEGPPADLDESAALSSSGLGNAISEEALGNAELSGEALLAKTLSVPSVTDAAGRGDLNDRNTVNSEAAAGADGAKKRRRK